MFSKIRAVTFDCFGTLIDWKYGQERVIRQLPSLRAHSDQIHALCGARERAEQELQRGTWLPYAEILARSINKAAQEVLQLELSPREATAFAAGQLGWPAFPETAPALIRLSNVLPIGLLSNCDQEVLALCARKHLGAPIQWLVSAERAQSYKPAPRHWEIFLLESGLAAEEVLHVSFTRKYDLDQAASMGFALGFIARFNLPTPDDLPLTIQAKDLTDLVDQIVTGLRVD
ncbi:MAG: hypothetical protein MK209_05210 [Planctomycetes bacterium]|nr:hypothetical protein [Planctomycetota bacterium]